MYNNSILVRVLLGKENNWQPPIPCIHCVYKYTYGEIDDNLTDKNTKRGKDRIDNDVEGIDS